jgi:hypothetical protein
MIYIYQLTSLAAALAIPVLSVLAYRGWAKHARKDLARWRSVVGILSIVIASLSWLALVFPVVLDLMGFDAKIIVMTSTRASIILLLAIAGTPLAFALRGASRIQALLAALLIVALWFTSGVH